MVTKVKFSSNKYHSKFITWIIKNNVKSGIFNLYYWTLHFSVHVSGVFSSDVIHGRERVKHEVSSAK